MKKDLVIQETWPKPKGLCVLEGKEDNTAFKTGYLYVMCGLPVGQLRGEKTWAPAL